MKVIFSGQWFFVRYVLGSMYTQAALLLTSYPISLSGKYSFNELVNIISSTWSYRVIIFIFYFGNIFGEFSGENKSF